MTEIKFVDELPARESRPHSYDEFRAALRVGMLLRDSETAREVRTYLLDAERPDATVHFLVPKSLPEALRAYAIHLGLRRSGTKLPGRRGYANSRAG